MAPRRHRVRESGTGSVVGGAALDSGPRPDERSRGPVEAQRKAADAAAQRWKQGGWVGNAPATPARAPDAAPGRPSTQLPETYKAQDDTYRPGPYLPERVTLAYSNPMAQVSNVLGSSHSPPRQWVSSARTDSITPHPPTRMVAKIYRPVPGLELSLPGSSHRLLSAPTSVSARVVRIALRAHASSLRGRGVAAGRRRLPRRRARSRRRAGPCT